MFFVGCEWGRQYAHILDALGAPGLCQVRSESNLPHQAGSRLSLPRLARLVYRMSLHGNGQTPFASS